MTASNTDVDHTEQSNGPSPEEKHDVALVHLEANLGGHWWQNFDAEPPDYYTELQSGHKQVTDGNALLAEVAPDPPDTVQWDEYVAYNCVICRDACINRRDSVPAENKECWQCHSVPE